MSCLFACLSTGPLMDDLLSSRLRTSIDKHNPKSFPKQTQGQDQARQTHNSFLSTTWLKRLPTLCDLPSPRPTAKPPFTVVLSGSGWVARGVWRRQTYLLQAPIHVRTALRWCNNLRDPRGKMKPRVPERQMSSLTSEHPH